MKDYKTIVGEVIEATEGIKDEKLKEMAFQKLLDHSLVNPLSSPFPRKGGKTSTATGPKAQGAKKRSATVAIKEASVREEVKSAFADVTPNMPGFKPLSSLKQKWEKYIWVLVVAKDKGIDAMTNTEIAYILTEKFSVGSTDKTVNNLTFKVETGYVQKRELDGARAWKVLIDGINAIKAESKDEQNPQT